MTRSDIDAAVERLAALQHGAFSRNQVRHAGGDDALVRRRIRSGRWHRPVEGALTLAGHPPTFEQRLWVARLDVPDAVITHESAGRLRRLTTFEFDDSVVLTVAHGGDRTPAAVCHQTRRDLAPLGEELPQLQGLRVSTVASTVAELASLPTMSKARLKLVVEDVLAGRRVRFEALVDAWSDARRRHLDVRNLGTVLGELGSASDVPTSELNRRLHRTLAAVPGPAARVEAPFPGRDLPGCAVDALIEPERIVVEADGRSWHTRERDYQRDRRRDRAAGLAGYVTARYTYAELADSHAVAHELTQLRIRRRLDLSLPPLSVAA